MRALTPETNLPEAAVCVQVAAVKLRGSALSQHAVLQFVECLAAEAAATVARSGQGSQDALLYVDKCMQPTQHVGQGGNPEQ